jgi:hypothetical protein
LRFIAIYYLGEREREKERKNNADHCWPRSISMRTNLWIQVCTVKEFALWCAEMAGRFFTWASNWSLHNVDSLECLKLTVPEELGGNAAAKAYAYHMGSQLLRDIGQSDSKLQIELYRIKLAWPDGQAAVSAVAIVLLFSHIFHNVWYIYIYIYTVYWYLTHTHIYIHTSTTYTERDIYIYMYIHIHLHVLAPYLLRHTNKASDCWFAIWIVTPQEGDLELQQQATTFAEKATLSDAAETQSTQQG